MPQPPRPGDPDDPGGLIAEAYRIDAITEGECRSIFLDWSLKAADPVASAARLLARFAADNPDHPMTGILRAAQGALPPIGRRGGRAGRRR